VSTPKSRTPVKAPRLPKTALPPATMPRDLPADGETCSHLEYQHLDLNGRSLARPHFEEIIFVQMSASESHFQDLRMEDVRLTGCNLANATWLGLACARVEFTDCLMTGFTTLNAFLLDTVFKECKFDFAQFYQAKLQGARFDSCPLTSADFRESDLTGVVFTHCDLTSADFRGATLSGADIRGCTIEGMRAGPTELHGAIVDEAQALALIRAMGITIA
jgi:fluoroquinolone resistance protein